MVRTRDSQSRKRSSILLLGTKSSKKRESSATHDESQKADVELRYGVMVSTWDFGSHSSGSNPGTSTRGIIGPLAQLVRAPDS